MIEDVLKSIDTKMDKSVKSLEKDMAGIRTGRAAPSLVENIRVDYHGVPTPLNQIASISAPEVRLLVIQPWDRSALSSVEKAILKSDLGLSPNNDGNIIRLVIPPLTEERRMDLVKLLRKRVEDSKVSLRNLRREAMDQLKGLEKEKKISQDDLRRALDRLQKVTDCFVEETDKIGDRKKNEIMEF
ncbi:MAG: ribosome recycling factor [Chloroflexota bacterium]|nr:ribosome recycling factor [Chloroflexota bacterium]